MKIAISAESTIDLPKSILEEYDIKTIPFQVILGDKVELDGEVSSLDIYKYVDETGILPRTSAINEYAFKEHFKALLKDYDAVVHVSLSSGISSACNNAKVVAGMMQNVYIVDSKSLSTGIALLAIYARELANKGLSPREIADSLRARRNSLQVSFVINTLDYLYKGGRCTSLQRFGANLLRLKPQIIVKEGKMDSYKKYRGKNAAVIANYCADTLVEFNTPDLTRVFITYSGLTSEDMIEAAREALKAKGFKQIYETDAGATISSHCGPKCLGILYFNDGNN